jgi:hypothetical protein
MMAEPELGNAGVIRKELYKADPDTENADERLKQLTTGKLPMLSSSLA